MRFQVPQFINIEDKIFGPLTVKQFVYLVGGAGMVYILYRFLPFYLAVVPIGLFAALAVSLAFVKVNNKPFIFTLEAALKYAFSTRLYLWKHQPRKIEAGDESREAGHIEIPALSESKLKDLTWSLDINQSVKKGAGN